MSAQPVFLVYRTKVGNESNILAKPFQELFGERLTVGNILHTMNLIFF
jgi:hypothetical protein